MADSRKTRRPPAQVECPTCGFRGVVPCSGALPHPVSGLEVWTGETRCAGCRNDLAFAQYPAGTHTWQTYEEKSMSRYIVKTRRGFVYNSHVYMFYMHTPVQTEREWSRGAFHKMVSRFAGKNFNTVVVDHVDDGSMAKICDIYVRIPDDMVPDHHMPYGSVMAEKMLAGYACQVYGSAIITSFPFFTGIFPEGMHVFHMGRGGSDEPSFMGGISHCANYFKAQVDGMSHGVASEKITIGVRI